MTQSIQDVLDGVFRNDRARILATLIRLLGDFDIAEDAMHAAFTVALEQWPVSGVPANPRSWLISTGRFRAIDSIRKDARRNEVVNEIARTANELQEVWPAIDDSDIEDDRLRLIFTCCHPLLSPEGQIALILREVCGLSTEDIASAFLTSRATIAQRIVRAKSKIREARIGYEVPPMLEMPGRLHRVLHVVYLLFNEGYYSNSGENLLKHALTDEAIRLGRLLVALTPDPEVDGLLGMMLLNDARRESRVTDTGDVVLLADQDRSLWNMDQITEGVALVNQALAKEQCGPLALQAGITALHVTGALQGKTDWNRIIDLYDVLLERDASPVVELNRAAAVSMAEGPLAGLKLVEELIAGEKLNGYGLAYSTQADCYRRLGRYGEAWQAYAHALSCTQQAAEIRFYERRMREVALALKGLNQRS